MCFKVDEKSVIYRKTCFYLDKGTTKRKFTIKSLNLNYNDYFTFFILSYTKWESTTSLTSQIQSLVLGTLHNQCKCEAAIRGGGTWREWGEMSCWYNVLTQQRLRQVLSWLPDWVEIVRPCGSNSGKWAPSQGWVRYCGVIRVTETINCCFHRGCGSGVSRKTDGRLSTFPAFFKIDGSSSLLFVVGGPCSVPKLVFYVFRILKRAVQFENFF